MTASPMKFTRFAIERCIRVIYEGSGHTLYPIDARQDLGVISPIWCYIGSLAPSGLQLVVHEDTLPAPTTALVIASISSIDPGDRICEATFGGVWWRVLGFTEGFPDEPCQLAVTDIEESAVSYCSGLEALLPGKHTAAPFYPMARHLAQLDGQPWSKEDYVRFVTWGLCVANPAMTPMIARNGAAFLEQSGFTFLISKGWVETATATPYKP